MITSTADCRWAASDSHWAESAEIFLGTLQALDPATTLESLPREKPKSVYLSLFKDANQQVISGQSDWLIAGHQKPASVFRFLFHSKEPDRLHFMITGSGADHEKKMGVSRNGYLGLYQYASVSGPFKFEPLYWSDDSLICRWRDHQGHTVRLDHDQTVADPFFSYLRVLEGKETIFLLTRVCNGRPVQAPSNSA
jgi:hypothetical protein